MQQDELAQKLEESVEKSASFINQYTYDLLLEWGIPADWASLLNCFVLIFCSVFIVIFVHQIVTWMLRGLLYAFRNRLKTGFSTYLRENKFPSYVALIAPVSFIGVAIPIVFEQYPQWINPLMIVLKIYTIMMVVWILMSFIRSFGDLLRNESKYKHRPIQSYVQVVEIVIYLMGFLSLFPIFGQDPMAFFSYMGAISALLLIAFRETILGFMASIQVSTNDIVRIGDWIEMPKYGADGQVIGMSLTTIKVQNWDMTITMIPSFTLIQDSFKNWRGMREFGGRRIKRSLIIKQSSVRYIEDSEIENFMKIEGIREYIVKLKAEIDAHNQSLNLDREFLVNGRNMTNLGLFRQYANWYVKKHPGVAKDKIIMVRQMAPTPQGLPLEVYLFADTILWVEYESIASDIFDHLISAVPYFDLQIYEEFSDLSQEDMRNRLAISHLSAQGKINLPFTQDNTKEGN